MTNSNPIRLLIDEPAIGSWNMAVDQAILEYVSELGIPTVRFYAWKPATLSLGYFQTVASRLEHLESSSTALVRRSSGGGAILHHHEITYSIVIPSNDRWSNRNTDLYDMAHQGIIDVFSEYQIVLESYLADADVKAKPDSPNPFLCFERRSNGDLILDDYKVVGSAQRRSKNALLQHGSILLQRSEFAPQLPGICDLSNKTLETNVLIPKLAAAFCQQFDFAPESGPLSRDETKLAQQIQTERFENAQWTQKRSKT